MKNRLILLIVAIILLLDYAAFDDITTGKEQSFVLEYFMLIGSLIILVSLYLFVLKKKGKKHNNL